MLECLLHGFWASRPSKMELSLKRDAHFDKIASFAPGTFFDANWSPKGRQNGAKKALKVHEKSDGFFDGKMRAVRGALGSCFGVPGSLKVRRGWWWNYCRFFLGGGPLLSIRSVKTRCQTICRETRCKQVKRRQKNKSKQPCWHAVAPEARWRILIRRKGTRFNVVNVLLNC